MCHETFNLSPGSEALEHLAAADGDGHGRVDVAQEQGIRLRFGGIQMFSLRV